METDLDTAYLLYLEGVQDKNVEKLKTVTKKLGVKKSNEKKIIGTRKCQSSFIDLQTLSSCQKIFGKHSTIFECDKGHYICRSCHEINTICKKISKGLTHVYACVLINK